ncbi:protein CHLORORESPIRATORY REDUCTION 42, chloroplastic [Diospyros lotus]|uniref:protein CHLORORESPIRATORY REDUCTION 42, chloroplastic n=1 Tax=Diospyros lotus TaxID=55363 RepID=UPI00225BAA8B|nr:protein CHLORORESPIRATORY REDUCTION 42, chloroplastic [Diospyros lotus]
MAFALSSSAAFPHSNDRTRGFVHCKRGFNSQTARQKPLACFESESSPAAASNSGLQIGSPIIVIEAPKMIKTAASVPCLRVNAGLVKPGDVGRIVSRKPKDVWAVRLAIGTYLIDGKYFKPLELDD